MRLRLGNLVACINGRDDIRIVRVNRCKNGRNRDLSEQQWLDIFHAAAVQALWYEHAGMEDDIFIFHGFMVELSDGVKLSGQDQCQCRTGYGVGAEIDLHDASSFFDVDKLHLIVPVRRHGCKIQRD